MLERRRHDRDRAFQAGAIAHREGRATLDCVVRNVSDGGALLLVDDPMLAPCDLDLTLARGTRRARVVWRGAAALGVVFAPAAAAPDVAARSATVVSMAEVCRARSRASDEDRLAERVARIARPSSRPRPDWAWPRLSR